MDNTKVNPLAYIDIDFSIDKSKPKVINLGNERYNFVINLIGANRTGKTRTLIEIIKAWKASRVSTKSNIYKVYGFDPQNKFPELCDEDIDPSNKEWATELLSVRNALLVLDDYKILNRSNFPVNGFDELIYRRNNNNVDIILVCHSPALVMNFLTYFITHYYIFYTQATDGVFEKKIPNYTLLIAASRLVNTYVTKYGRGTPFQHSSGESYVKNFPYIVVDNEKGTLKAYNMSKFNTNDFNSIVKNK